MTKAYMYIAFSILIAIAISAMTGSVVINQTKILGMASSFAVMLIPFIILYRAFYSGSVNFFMGSFVGGFLFKLVALLLIVWWAVAKAGYDKIDFSISCLSFLFALQISESIYFWGRGKVKGNKTEMKQYD